MIVLMVMEHDGSGNAVSRDVTRPLCCMSYLQEELSLLLQVREHELFVTSKCSCHSLVMLYII